MSFIAISIIIPVYNSEKHLEECLESCVNQTLSSIEIICIDDGSTDNSYAILDKYQKKYENIIVLKQKNQGPGIARNNGMKIATGEFVAFIDSDDYYPHKNVLKMLYETALEKNVKICGGANLRLQDGVIKGDTSEIFSESREVLYKNYQQAGPYTQFIYNRDLLRKNDIIFPGYLRYEDPIFFVKVMICEGRFYVVRDYVYVTRQTDKIIRYGNEEILKGVLLGINDILCISRDNQLEKLHANIVQSLQAYILYIYVELYKGSESIRKYYEDVLSNIDKNLLDKNAKKISKHFFLNEKEIKELVLKSIDKGKKLIKKVKEFDRILIYGAGKAGHYLCDYLLSEGYTGNVEFAVSSRNPQYTAYGKKIISIFDDIKNKDTVLVLIANKNSANIMEKNAQDLGFKHIEVVPVDEIWLFSAGLDNDNYISIF